MHVLPTFVWINLASRFPCALCLQALELYLNFIEVLCHGPKVWRQVNIHDRVGGDTTIAFNAINKAIDSIAKLLYFS
jgi:hypothetical protein